MRRFVTHLSAVSLVNIVNGLLGLAFVPFAVRRLGAENYGLFSIYSVVAGYVALFELGLGKNLQRLLAGQSDEAWRRDQIRTAAGLYATVCVVLLVLTPVLTWVVPQYVFPVAPERRLAVQLVTAFAVGEYVLGVPASIVQTYCVASERFDRYARFQTISGVLRYGLSFLAVATLRRPEMVVAVIVARRVLDSAVAPRIMGHLPAGAWRPRWAPRAYAALLAQSSVLSLAQLLQLSVVSAGAVLVNWTAGLRALGVYRAVFDLASKVWFFSNTLGLVVFPRFVRLLSDPGRREVLQSVMPAVVRASWVAYGLLAIIGAIVGPILLAHLGLQGGDYAPLFVIVIAGIAFNAHSNLAYEFLQAMGGYARVVALAAVSLAGMVVAFAGIRTISPALAIGWAWFVSQACYAAAVDASVLGVLRVRGADAWTDLSIRLLVLGAVLAVALYQLALAPRAAAVAGALAWLLALVAAARGLRGAASRPRLAVPKPAVA